MNLIIVSYRIRSHAYAMVVKVAAVSPETDLAEVVRLLLARQVKAVPVVAPDETVLGLITGGDLLTRGGMAIDRPTRP